MSSTVSANCKNGREVTFSAYWFDAEGNSHSLRGYLTAGELLKDAKAAGATAEQLKSMKEQAAEAKRRAKMFVRR